MASASTFPQAIGIQADFSDRALWVPEMAHVMTPLLVEQVLQAQRVVERRRAGRCRGSWNVGRSGEGRPCRYGTLPGVPACLRHLDPEELSALQQMLEGAQRLVDRWLPHLPPACWFWPLPETVRASVPFSTEASLFTWQRDRCAICGRHGRRGGTSSDSLVLDHDHQTGQARGFLCYPCNKRESQREPGDGRFANYRRRPPAVLLGMATLYSHAVRLRPPLPRQEPAPPSPAGLSKSLAKIRKMAPQIEHQLRTAAANPKSHKYVGEDVWRTLQALVPVLLDAVEKADRELPHVELVALTHWLQQFPPSPAQQ